jgi:hypothetical protein
MCRHHLYLGLNLNPLEGMMDDYLKAAIEVTTAQAKVRAMGADMVYCKYVDREPGKLILRSASELVRPIEVLGELAEGCGWWGG